MKLLKLSPAEYYALNKQIQSTKDVRVLKRAQALISLSEGIAVNEVSERLGISIRTVYHWVSVYKDRKREPFLDRLKDRSHPGRPAKKSQIVLNKIDQLMEQSPREYRYSHSEWTASLLCNFLNKQEQIKISTKTIRRCLKQLGYVWKRPRYVLARQSPTWRQEKGDSNVD